MWRQGQGQGETGEPGQNAHGLCLCSCSSAQAGMGMRHPRDRRRCCRQTEGLGVLVLTHYVLQQHAATRARPQRHGSVLSASRGSGGVRCVHGGEWCRVRGAGSHPAHLGGISLGLVLGRSRSALLLAKLHAIVLQVPLLERRRVNLHNGVLHQRLRAHQLVVGGVVRDIQDARLARHGLRFTPVMKAATAAGADSGKLA